VVSEVEESSPKLPISAPPKQVITQNLQHGERILWLRKTEQPDVYEVHEHDNLQSDKMGMAHVASLVTSRMLRGKFKEATVTVLIPFRCTFNESFKKWHPLTAA
jgi:hypothetical protein